MLLGIKDIIDILLVAFILFAIYRILRRSGASNLIWGILAFILTWLLVSYVLQLELTSALFDRFVSVGAIALIVIFQEEIRHFFYRIGARFNIEHFKDRWSKIKHQQHSHKQVDAILNACTHMSASKTGALIIISQEQELKTYADTGEYIDASISTRLLENIFFKNTPLHDGALIIHKGRIWSAGCILPVSKRTDLPKRYGLRHRAAIGLTEKTDALAIVISEETGKISVAKDNDIQTITPNRLETYLLQAFGIEEPHETNKTDK
jgi:uncharacterized protein (TIGR00159 family)